MSPGFAVATKKGPVCGLPKSARVTPCASMPPESSVVVRTVSAGHTVRTGARWAENSLDHVVGLKSCTRGGPAGRAGRSRPVKACITRVFGLLLSGESAVPSSPSPLTLPLKTYVCLRESVTTKRTSLPTRSPSSASPSDA
ncbi:hypothetical protein [Corallococcus aberystwythensis]|uniref:hypothetical protein n=1 Tax=Corallococcus aberystwythensis TaxID=2316722 RepID=UPI0013154D17|nr:hypothetical protein [Corallococcus aberystwythensis]